MTSTFGARSSVSELKSCLPCVVLGALPGFDDSISLRRHRSNFRLITFWMSPTPDLPWRNIYSAPDTRDLRCWMYIRYVLRVREYGAQRLSVPDKPISLAGCCLSVLDAPCLLQPLPPRLPWSVALNPTFVSRTSEVPLRAANGEMLICSIAEMLEVLEVLGQLFHARNCSEYSIGHSPASTLYPP